MINAIGDEQFPWCSTVLFNGEQASRGSAMYNSPHKPADLNGGAETINWKQWYKIKILYYNLNQDLDFLKSKKQDLITHQS